MKPDITSSIPRNVSIDIIRGLAILSVLLLHLNIHFSYSGTFLKEWLPGKLFSLLFWSGFYGVVIFFTLSGYLITLSALRKWGALFDVNVMQFYALRAARILPLLIALLLVLVCLHYLQVSEFVVNEEQVSLGQTVFSALTFHINWLQIQVGYLPANWDVLWSISIEESFYLVFPVLCLLIRKEWHLVLILCTFFVISPLARTLWYVGNELGDRNHLAYIDSLSVGCFVALASVRLKLGKRIQLTSLVLGAGLLILVLVYRSFVYQAGLTKSGLNITLLSTGVGLLLVYLHHPSSTNFVCPRAFAWLQRMGEFSYEIYLTHMFVVLGGAAAYRAMSLNPGWLIPTSVGLIVISYWLGMFIHQYFSEPLNQRLRTYFYGAKGIR